jgi:opacity protein-like surface antigen
MKWSGLLVVVILTVATVASAYAQGGLTNEEYFGDQAPKFAFGLRMGFHDISGIPYRGETYFPEALDFDTDVGYGASLEYWFTPTWSIELVFDHVKIEDTYGDAETVDLGLNDWAVSAKYTLRPMARLRPFVLAGIDVFTADVGYSIPEPWVTGDVDSTWGWHIGGGVEYRFTDNLGLFVEVRYRDGQTNVDTTVWYPTVPWSSTNEIDYGGFVGVIGVKVYW